ncbi:MAG: glycoside hydrolase family 3 C-terminal domain-containing protein [Dehalococcoidia bacterium]|nr:glycoside hydrolase family 3 C-terminal domain-containing protein [Dehalococcoidia bacterium]
MKALDRKTTRKIEDLIHALSLEEKVSMLAGVDYWHTRAFERLGIPAIKMTDGPHGTRTVDDSNVTLQGTCYPTGSALAATWNTELVNRIGAAIGEEAKANGCSILLGPCVNIQRSPLAGRNFESYSEDAYLSSRMAVAHITGVQSREVAACVKHYALNNSEYQRFTMSSEAYERTIREIYLPSFEAAVKEAKSLVVMSSYNRVNGEYASASRMLLTDILKGEWGFEGPVISDWYGTYSTVPTANAGLDIEMPGPARFFGDDLLAAVREGKVSLETVNDKVRRLLRLMARLDILRAPRKPLKTSSNTPRHRALAREAAREAIVLLKNEGGILPLHKNRLKTIAILGPNADNVCIEGAGSSRVKPYYVASPLQAIRKKCGNAVKVLHEPGCRINRFTSTVQSSDFQTGQYENGFHGEYFASNDLSGKSFATRIEKEMSFAFIGSSGNPESPSDISRDTNSARWTAKFIAQESGSYSLGILTDGLTRLCVNDKLLSDTWAGTPRESGVDRAEKTAVLPMVKGNKYDIRIEYRAHPASRSIVRRFRFGCEPPAPADMMERAVKAAAAADVAIVFAGLNEEWEGEGFDRQDMELPMRQNELIEKVGEVNPNTVVVLNCGSPLAIVRWLDKVAGVVEMWFGGQECGNAIADVLFGTVNPSGRLPMSFPKRLEDNPAYINYPGENGKVLYGEGIFVGYRYYDKKKIEPLFPFGYGLSYATFEYGKLRLKKKTGVAGNRVLASVDIKNTSKRAGRETVQFYVSDVKSSLVRPVQELKAFSKVLLRPDETKTVTVTLDERSFSFYDPGKKDWIMEPGEFRIRAGSSSRDIRATASFRVE